MKGQRDRKKEFIKANPTTPFSNEITDTIFSFIESPTPPNLTYDSKRYWIKPKYGNGFKPVPFTYKDLENKTIEGRHPTTYYPDGAFHLAPYYGTYLWVDADYANPSPEDAILRNFNHDLPTEMHRQSYADNVEGHEDIMLREATRLQATDPMPNAINTPPHPETQCSIMKRGGRVHRIGGMK